MKKQFKSVADAKQAGGIHDFNPYQFGDPRRLGIRSPGSNQGSSLSPPSR